MTKYEHPYKIPSLKKNELNSDSTWIDLSSLLE